MGMQRYQVKTKILIGKQKHKKKWNQGKNVYVKNVSGKNFERNEYRRLICKLKSGDILFVKSIDCLGRNYSEIIEQWHSINKEMEVDIVLTFIGASINICDSFYTI